MPTPVALLGSLLFGTFGLAAFVYGKKSARFRPMALGTAMMVYPFFVSQTWLLYLIGSLLCVALFL